MDHDQPTEAQHTDIELPRTEAQRITELLRSDESALARAARQVVDNLGETDNYAGYQSAPTL